MNITAAIDSDERSAVFTSDTVACVVDYTPGDRAPGHYNLTYSDGVQGFAWTLRSAFKAFVGRLMSDAGIRED